MIRFCLVAFFFALIVALSFIVGQATGMVDIANEERDMYMRGFHSGFMTGFSAAQYEREHEQKPKENI